MQEILHYNKKIALEKLIAPENLQELLLNTCEEFLHFEHLLKEDPAIKQYFIMVSIYHKLFNFQKVAALGGTGVEGFWSI